MCYIILQKLFKSKAGCQNLKLGGVHRTLLLLKPKMIDNIGYIIWLMTFLLNPLRGPMMLETPV